MLRFNYTTKNHLFELHITVLNIKLTHTNTLCNRTFQFYNFGEYDHVLTFWGFPARFLVLKFYHEDF